MCHALLRDASLYAQLLTFDQDLAAEARAAGCGFCGGRLHSARYPRKPRGGLEDLGPDYTTRLSFCCAVDGCRRRTTPPSVRYLGRRVYLGAVVVLVTALRGGITATRAAQLRAWLGVACARSRAGAPGGRRRSSRAGSGAAPKGGSCRRWRRRRSRRRCWSALRATRGRGWSTPSAFSRR